MPTTQLCDWIFHRNGQPIREFRKSWKSATRKAGCTGLLFHDFRRSGVRNLRKAGVREIVAMQLSGHRTRAVFDRYNIVDESDVREALQKVGQYRATAAKQKVVAMS
jgi:integrase